MSNQGDVDDDQECNMNLKPDTIQNCDMGLCARSWFTSIWSQRVILKLCVFDVVFEETVTGLASEIMLHFKMGPNKMKCVCDAP